MITDDVRLVDHHCHGVVLDDLDDDGFRSLATESDWLSAHGLETLNSPFGLAIRKVCSPTLDLPPHAPVAEYLRRRSELGQREVSARLMATAGLEAVLLDTGFEQSAVAGPAQMAHEFGVRSATILRLEAVAESLAEGSTAATFARDFAEALDVRQRDAVGFKSISAYRAGLDIAATPPSDTDVARAAEDWLASASGISRPRIEDPVLLSFLVWTAVEHRKPIQFHVGFGDSDVQLFRADPSRMTPFLRATRESGAAIMLLHTYPFTREAGCLAHVFPHVYLDVGEVSHYLGPSAKAAIRESVELAPFDKVLYSSDAYGLAEHYAVSAALWRVSMGALIDEWIAGDWIGTAEAERLVTGFAAGNAQRVYGL